MRRYVSDKNAPVKRGVFFPHEKSFPLKYASQNI